jgi:hypothetical protein
MIPSTRGMLHSRSKNGTKKQLIENNATERYLHGHDAVLQSQHDARTTLLFVAFGSFLLKIDESGKFSEKSSKQIDSKNKTRYFIQFCSATW